MLNLTMETGNYLDPREGWAEDNGEAWTRLQSLLELVRQENRRTELSPERQEQLRERVLERLARSEIRRRRRRALVAAAGAVLLVAVAARLVVRARAAWHTATG